jgi:hypothetical protein
LLALKEQMTKYGKCKLCCSQKELKESHIISSFLFKWLKRTSVTGFFRSGETPNQRKQDGWKLFLLCEDCEKLFSKWEHCFAKNILEPITEEKQIEPYGSWLLKFSTSLSWRILQFAKKERPLNHFSNGLISSAENASTVWREFLLDKRPNPGRFEHHMLLFPELITEYKEDLPQNINQYILRSIDIDVPCSKKEAYIYLKIGRIFIFGFIKIQNPKNWHQTKIHVKNGTLLNKHYKIPKEIVDFIFYKARKGFKTQQKMSEKQWDQIGKDYEKNIKHFGNSEMFKAIEQDYKLFGDAAFADHK